MAQLVERVLGKDEVGGSNPPSSSKRTFHSEGSFFFSVALVLNEIGIRTLRYSVASLLTNPTSNFTKGHLLVSFLRIIRKL